MNINKNIAISETGFIFNPTTGDSFTTNRIGHDIIRLLQAGHDPADVLTAIYNQYSIDRQTLEKDVADFMYMLKNYQILRTDD